MRPVSAARGRGSGRALAAGLSRGEGDGHSARPAAGVTAAAPAQVWLDPNEVNEISMANSRQNVRKLVKDGFVIKKPQKVHSRFRANAYADAKRKVTPLASPHRPTGRPPLSPGAQRRLAP